MTYIERLIKEILIEFPKLADKPELVDLYAAIVLAKGIDLDNRAVHDAWSVWQNRIRPDHRSIIDYDDLSPEVQDMDTKYTRGLILAALRADVRV
jgi:hypothetical protein